MPLLGKFYFGVSKGKFIQLHTQVEWYDLSGRFLSQQKAKLIF